MALVEEKNSFSHTVSKLDAVWVKYRKGPEQHPSFLGSPLVYVPAWVL